ncbi:uncharacterized protein LOC103313893 isoform X3 [Tribolium castaneum]|uniref:uncharacterized protein LOC103313893 isoform X3 n=1 Tax=Tribolium castaneum TaxID=7070 RepID=UPI00077DC064|nr:PREDICTED: uncharacterized protein LOC103313893 isoform X2 [Tribolium castaneum]|eukprot:XP_015837866.1 PREDICTED: uncharacterized protein LOC103313893 isoform X2 [Tribolium castaneum]
MDEGGGRRCSTAIFCGRTGLLVLMTGYAFVGALLFKALEGGNDGDVPAHVQRSREDCLRELWLITERLNVLYEKNWTRLVTEQLKRFERAVVEAGKADGASNPAAPHWTFGGALLYSLTLLTTVGYGRLSPRTALGKVVAVIYALIGVPLMLILLSALGAMLASGARKAYSKICCQHDTNRKSPSVGYHKAPSSPSGKLYCKTHEDSASIQIASAHSTPNHGHFSNSTFKPLSGTLQTKSSETNVGGHHYLSDAQPRNADQELPHRGLHVVGYRRRGRGRRQRTRDVQPRHAVARAAHLASEPLRVAAPGSTVTISACQPRFGHIFFVRVRRSGRFRLHQRLEFPRRHLLLLHRPFHDRHRRQIAAKWRRPFATAAPSVLFIPVPWTSRRRHVL